MRVNIYAAKTQLSRLVDRAGKGEEIVITRHGRPVAKLVGLRAADKPRKLGQMRGRIWVAEDFDAPLPFDPASAFEDPT